MPDTFNKLTPLPPIGGPPKAVLSVEPKELGFDLVELQDTSNVVSRQLSIRNNSSKPIRVRAEMPVGFAQMTHLAGPVAPGMPINVGIDVTSASVDLKSLLEAGQQIRLITSAGTVLVPIIVFGE